MVINDFMPKAFDDPLSKVFGGSKDLGFVTITKRALNNNNIDRFR